MEELPNGKKEYKDVSQLEEDVKKIYNANRGKIIEVLEYNEDGSQTHATFDLTKVVECEIIVDKDINKYRNILSLSS
jgi:hypothetical protein